MATMKLSCPECGTAIPAENINIQAHTAVCPACNTVFRFELPEEKAKRRKAKQPEQLELYEGHDKLHMAFRTNFRLDQNENFIGAGIVAIMFSIISITMTGAYFAGDAPIILPLMMPLVMLAAVYAMGVIAYNKTHIEMQHNSIQVSRKPLPGSRVHQVNLHDVVGIYTEETAVSKKEGYDTPRYQVRGETTDGSRRVIITDLTEDYAYFVTQRLQERLRENLHIEAAIPDASRLTYADVMEDDAELYESENAMMQHENHSK